MATLVILTRPKFSADPVVHAQAEQVGDVVEVVPDGWHFSRLELAHPGWRIVSMPAVSPDEARTLLAPGRVAAWEGRIAPHRLAGLDLDSPAWPADHRAHFADDRRIPPVFASPLSFADLESARVVRVPAPHPNVIGPNRRVIG